MEISESITESKTGIIDTNPAENGNETLLHGTTEDGQIVVQTIVSEPVTNSQMGINISFLDKHGSLVSNVNYMLEVTQQGKQILLQNNGYSEGGLVTVSTLPLQSDKPVDISVTIQGIGLPENSEDWMPPNGQVVLFNVVPEFGAMPVIIFAVSISCIIVFSTKSRLKSYL